MGMNWGEYFGAMLEVVKLKSKDPSTKVGAIITGRNQAVISTGFNGFPIGVDDSEDRYEHRETKYKFVIHAEHNAILLAARRGIALEDCTLWVNRYPCHDCAKAIIQSGIKYVIIIDKDGNKEFQDRWSDSVQLAQQMFEEAGVSVDWRTNG